MDLFFTVARDTYYFKFVGHCHAKTCFESGCLLNLFRIISACFCPALTTALDYFSNKSCSASGESKTSRIGTSAEKGIVHHLHTDLQKFLEQDVPCPCGELSLQKFDGNTFESSGIWWILRMAKKRRGPIKQDKSLEG